MINIRKVENKVTDLELVKLLVGTVDSYAMSIRSRYFELGFTSVLTILSWVIYYLTYRINDSHSVVMLIINILLTCVVLVTYGVMGHLFTETRAMLKAFRVESIKNVKEDLDRWIGIFDDWDGANYLRVINYFIQNESSFEISVRDDKLKLNIEGNEVIVPVEVTGYSLDNNFDLIITYSDIFLVAVED